jgi:hypothetical protein
LTLEEPAEPADLIEELTITGLRVERLDATDNGLILEAVMDGRDGDGKHTFGATAISGAGASEFGAAGAFALNVSVTGSEAYLAQNSSVNAGDDGNRGDVTLTAVNRSDSTVLATALQTSDGSEDEETDGTEDGATALQTSDGSEDEETDGTEDGGSFGLGGSFALNVGVNTARAEIAGGATLTGAGALSLAATGEHALTTTAEAGAGGDLAISPAVALGVGVNQTWATLPDGDALVLGGGLSLSATPVLD